MFAELISKLSVPFSVIDLEGYINSDQPLHSSKQNNMKTMQIKFAARFAVALCALLVLGLLLAPPEAAGCRISLHFRYLGPNGSQESTYETAVADFDGDGHLDLAVPLALAGTIQIYRGNGDGTFAAPVSYPAPFVESIIAGDFNGDGKPDLAAAAAAFPMFGGGVRILLNDGSGGFGNPSTLFPAGSLPEQVVVADFNSDGNLDLTVPDFDAGTNQVLLGDGHGGFGAPISTSGGGGGFVVAGDFNSDGKMDLAVATTDLKILLGNGAGAFTMGNSYSCRAGQPNASRDGRFQPRRHSGPRGRSHKCGRQVYTFLGTGWGRSSRRRRSGQRSMGSRGRSISTATATSIS